MTGEVPSSRRLNEWLTNVRAGVRLLKNHVEVKSNSLPDEDLWDSAIPDHEKYLPPSSRSVSEHLKENPEYLRECFADELINLAAAYDSLDHKYNADKYDTKLQADCRATRDLAWSLDISSSQKKK